ncbi:hypothetical protein MJH12_14565, partial [bacterium]|nr:hypothetical protein [bacterium]
TFMTDNKNSSTELTWKLHTTKNLTLVSVLFFFVALIISYSIYLFIGFLFFIPMTMSILFWSRYKMDLVFEM